jgi:hypothetical protein
MVEPDYTRGKARVAIAARTERDAAHHPTGVGAGARTAAPGSGWDAA